MVTLIICHNSIEPKDFPKVLLHALCCGKSVCGQFVNLPQANRWVQFTDLTLWSSKWPNALHSVNLVFH